MNSSLADLVTNLLAPTRAWGIAVALHLPILILAICRVPWRQLHVPRQLQLFFGATISLMVLWSIRTHLGLSSEFHLLGLTAVTLMFGWPLAIIAASVAQLALALSTDTIWDSYSVEFVASGALPVAVTEIVHRFSARKLPRHFFIYIFIGAFLGGALAMTSNRLALVVHAVANDAPNGSAVVSSLAYLPLMALPEALLNGMLMTLLVVYRPSWVLTFEDACYLQGK